MPREFHLSDQELLMAVDGELSARDAERAKSHMAACWACRARPGNCQPDHLALAAYLVGPRATLAQRASGRKGRSLWSLAQKLRCTLGDAQPENPPSANRVASRSEGCEVSWFWGEVED